MFVTQQTTLHGTLITLFTGATCSKPPYGNGLELLSLPKNLTNNSAVTSKNAVSANIKHNGYFHLTSNFRSIHSHGKRLYVHMFNVADTAFSYGTTLIVC